MLKESAKRFIEGARWQFAKTMPQFPHEYTLKDWNASDEFEEFARYIEANGVLCRKTFWERIYLDVGDRYYWYMSSPKEATLINRAKAEDDAIILRNRKK